MFIIAGSSNENLAKNLSAMTGIKLADRRIEKFRNSEIKVTLNQEIANQKVFVLQSFDDSVNDKLIELLLIILALKQAKSDEIILLVPYLAYSRQDKINEAGEALASEMFAKIISNSGADKLVTIDVHNENISSFYLINFINLSLADLFIKDIILKHKTDQIVIVSPDLGGVKRASVISQKLGCGLVVFEKRRDKFANLSMTHLQGELKNKIAIIIDDIIDSGKTLIKTVQEIKKRRPIGVYAYVTHLVSASNQEDIILKTELDGLVVSDSFNFDKQNNLNKIQIISICNILSNYINSHHKL